MYSDQFRGETRLAPGPSHSIEMLEKLVAGLEDVFLEVGPIVRSGDVLACNACTH